MALYVVAGGAWAYYIYAVFGVHLFPGGQMPAGRDMLEQIKARPPQWRDNHNNNL